MTNDKRPPCGAGDLVQRYREFAEVVIVERALRVGRMLEFSDSEPGPTYRAKCRNSR
jgi:hypothetical protein